MTIFLCPAEVAKCRAVGGVEPRPLLRRQFRSECAGKELRALRDRSWVTGSNGMQEAQPRFGEDLPHGLDADEENTGSFWNFGGDNFSEIRSRAYRPADRSILRIIIFFFNSVAQKGGRSCGSSVLYCYNVLATYRFDRRTLWPMIPV